MGIDEPSEFELLLQELEVAAARTFLGGPAPATETRERLSDDPHTLTEITQSLVDVPNLPASEPWSHVPTHRIDVSAELGVGTTVGQRYEVLGPALRGGNGWEVRHLVLRRRFFLRLLPRWLVNDPATWQKFRHDIRAAGMLGHEHIEFVTDLGLCEQYGDYLVKQWIDGPTLSEFLAANGPQSPQVALGFAHNIGEALATLHEIGIAHGHLTQNSVRFVANEGEEGWMLLDLGIPGSDPPLAPEQQGDEGSEPADQYALAYLTWQLLVGADGGLEDEPGVPPKMREVLRTAMAETPGERWPDMDGFVAEISRSLETPRKPSIHPFDRREATRAQAVALEQAEASVAADEPPEPFSEPRPQSMAIDILVGDKPVVQVAFGTGARLRREYRRNILTGGLFVPTPSELSVGQQVSVSLEFVPKARKLKVDGLVVTCDPGTVDRPRGYGVVFDVAARRRIEEFVRKLELGLGIALSDELVCVRVLDETATLSAGAAFLFSRIQERATVGPMRATFSGLSYDFDECLSELIEGGYLEVKPPSPSRPPMPTPTPPPPQPSRPSPQAKPSASKPRAPRRSVFENEPKLSARAAHAGAPKATSRVAAALTRPREPRRHEWHDVDRVLETVQYFEAEGNFMAARRVLLSATENAPHVAAFHHQLALVQARFDMALDVARTSIRRALELDPANEDFLAAERYLATLIEVASIRLVWAGRMANAVSWVRTEPELDLVWFEERQPEATILHAVNFASGVDKRASRGSRWWVVPENSLEFDALEHRKPVPMTSARERHARQIELARRFGVLGPHFEREPLDAARTTSSTLRATTEDGLRVHRGTSELAQLSTKPVFTPSFSPDEKNIAWSERKGDGYQLHIAPVYGASVVRAKLEGQPKFYWTDDSAAVVLLDPSTDEVFVIERRTGEPRGLSIPKASVDVVLVPSVDDDSLLVVARQVVGRSRWLCTWVEIRNGEVRGDYVLPAAVTTGVVRSDGKAALVMRDGRLLVADLGRKAVKLLSTKPVPESVAQAQWPIGRPLVIVEMRGKNPAVLSIDVDLLCG